MSGRLLALLVAVTAAGGQAAATIGSFAWLSRTLPVAEVGRFGLYVAIVSFVLALDGVRQGVVVSATKASHGSAEQMRHMAAIALLVGAVVGVVLVPTGRCLLGMGWIEIIPLALTAFLLLANGPAMARLEAAGGAHWAVALHSTAWAGGLGLAALSAVLAHSASYAAWCMLLAPAAQTVVLRVRRHFVRPSLRPHARARRIAGHGLQSTVVTAASGFLDKIALSMQSGPQAMGLYTPLAELTGRVSALAGLASNLFLRDETLAGMAEREARPRTRAHVLLIDAMFVMSAIGIVLTALMASHVVQLFVARSSPEEVAALRLLLAALALNVGAQWSAVTLKARGTFDLHRPYVVSFIAAAALAPLLVSLGGIVGAAGLVLVLRAADVALMFRARAHLTRVQLLSVGLAAIFSVVMTSVG